MATPRPVDKARANPVLYREKGNLSSRVNSPRPQVEITEARRENQPEEDSNRKEIILNIPQQQRDDEENTEKSEANSRAVSIANLAQINTDDSHKMDALHPSSPADLRANEKVEERNTGEDEEKVLKTDTSSSETQQQIQDDSVKAGADMAGTVSDNYTNQTEKKPKTITATEILNTKDTLATMDAEYKTLTQSITLDEPADDDNERTTVPEVNDEIQAVLLAQGQSSVFDLTQSVDIVDFELARRNAQAMQSGAAQQGMSGHNQSMSDINGAALRGKTCTPASLYTEVSELKFLGDDRSSQGPDTKEAMFQQALTLMDERCVSRDSSRMMGQLDHRYGYPLPHAEKSVYARSTTDTSVVATRDDVETPLVGVKHHPYGINRPERIYIHQRKPTPMEPLPAWKGYNGNVYFTPITVQPAKAVPHPPLPAPDLDQCSDKLQHILIRSRRPVRRSRSVSSKRTTTSSTASLSTSSNPRNSATSRGSGAVKRSQSMVSVKSKSSAFSKSSNVSRQMSLLDKRSVLSNFNENIEEDIQWIQGIESTGSLSILKNETEVKEQRKPTVRFEKEKICRGAPILRRSQSAKYTKTPIHPELKVHGGQCDKPTSNSQALIRARPHFPFYNYNRQIPKGINNSGLFSPQSYNSFLGSFDSLPPLEQLRASLKRMGSSSSKDELISMIPQRKSHSADIRKMPYVKFSPEYKHPHPPSRNITVK